MTDRPMHIDWPEAIELLVPLIGARAAESGRSCVVGITGPAGAGKSTLAAGLSAATDGVVISTDNYLPDYSEVPEAERDLPERADLALLVEHLRELRGGGSVRVPVWSFHEHRRVSTREVRPAGGPVLCEGLFALHESVSDAVDLRVYVEASAGVRWGRWEAIERRGERGLGVEAARAFFEGVAEPTFGRYAGVYRDSADVVVLNDGV